MIVDILSRKRNYGVCLLLILGLFSGCAKKVESSSVADTFSEIAVNTAVIVPQAIELSTIYGSITVDEPVLLELLASKAMLRLKHINQHGINDIVKPGWAFSRFDHSVGVFALTRLFGGSLEEQVAALLHDVSHTVFSHVGDLVFMPPVELEGSSSYQDDIHEWYIQQTDLAPILRTYAMEHVVSDSAKESFRRLEQEYPDICADRLDYQLRTGYVTGLLTLDDVQDILQHLHFEDNQWFFDDVHVASRFGHVSVWLTQHMYASAFNMYLYKVAAEAFKRAMDIELITADELHFSTDAVIWNRMQQSDDALLRALLSQIDQCDAAYTISDASDYDYFKKSKCRVVNPLVNTGNGMMRLADADELFAQAYVDIQQFCSEGIYLKFVQTGQVTHE